jgi:putative peptidoglycan lipid II flippase
LVSIARVLGALLTIALGVLSARYFGTSAPKDCYLVAQTIPGLVTTFLIGGLYSTLLVSLADIGRHEGIAGQKVFVRRTLGHLAFVLLPLVVAALAAPQVIVGWMAPGFDSERVALAASLLRLTALGAIGAIFFAIIRCLFETRYQFIVPGFVNLLIPLVSLGALILLVGRVGIYSLAIGPLVGVALALGLLTALVRRTLKDPPDFTPAPIPAEESTARHRRFWLALLPMSIGANFGQVNLLVDNVFASYLPTGSITMLGFAFVIVSNAQLLTTSSLAEVAFARLAAAALQGTQELTETLRSNLKYMVLITAPIAIGALAFGPPLVRFLFERGQFEAASSLGVASILACFSPQIFFMGYLVLLSLVLMARRRFAQVAWTSGAAILLNAVLDYLLMKPFGVKGIALATTAVTMAHVLILVPFVRREVPSIYASGDWSFVFRVLGGAGMMGVAVRVAAAIFERHFDTSAEAMRLLEVAGGLALGAVTYSGLLHLLRVEEARLLLWKILVSTRLVAPR